MRELTINQSPAEAYTTYTNYRGPSLQGARRAPLIVIVTKRKERKTGEKSLKKEKKERKKKKKEKRKRIKKKKEKSQRLNTN